MHAVIFAGGTLHPGRSVDIAIATADLIIAADSGARTAFSLGLVPSFIVGDFDSLNIPISHLKQMGSQIVHVPAEKDETDSELAVEVAIQQGASRITLLGGLGGRRFDHTVANILLLAGFDTIPIHIIDGPSTGWLLHGPATASIDGQSGDLLSLLPLAGKARNVRTTNLYYPLYGETLQFGKPRGLSNVLTTTHAEVSLERGMLLVIHTSIEEYDKVGSVADS